MKKTMLRKNNRAFAYLLDKKRERIPFCWVISAAGELTMKMKSLKPLSNDTCVLHDSDWNMFSGLYQRSTFNSLKRIAQQ